MVRIIAACLCLCFSNIVVGSGCPGEEMSTGWCYPTGTHETGGYLGWHGINPDPRYVNDGPHLAQDIKATEGNPVFAIADGIILISRTNVSGYGGTSPGGGMIIRHKTKDGEIDVLYAHVKNMTSKLGVIKGQHIADVGPYIGGSQHIHFAIAAPKRDNSNYLGTGTAVVWDGYANNDEGFVNPFDFLAKNQPASSTCLGSVCGDAVVYHGKLRTAQAVRFGLETVSVTDVGWRPFVDRCEDAQQYFYMTKLNPASPKFNAVPAPSSICANVVQACFAQ